MYTTYMLQKLWRPTWQELSRIFPPGWAGVVKNTRGSSSQNSYTGHTGTSKHKHAHKTAQHEQAQVRQNMPQATVHLTCSEVGLAQPLEQHALASLGPPS